jgi:hypothetical protein
MMLKSTISLLASWEILRSRTSSGAQLSGKKGI